MDFPPYPEALRPESRAQLVAENAALREENAALKARLAKTPQWRKPDPAQDSDKRMLLALENPSRVVAGHYNHNYKRNKWRHSGGWPLMTEPVAVMDFPPPPTEGEVP